MSLNDDNQTVGGSFNQNQTDQAQPFFCIENGLSVESDLMLHLKNIEQIPFLVTEQRRNEISMILKTISAKALNVPVLVVEKEEDVFPVFSAYTQLFSKQSTRRFFPIPSTTIGIPQLLDAPNLTLYQEAFNDVLAYLTKIKKGFTSRGIIPVVGGIDQYIDARATDLLEQFFLHDSYPAVFVIEKEYQPLLQKQISYYNQQLGGIRTGAKPLYRPSFARCRFIPIAPMTHQEKTVYLTEQIKGLLSLERKEFDKKGLSFFIETALSRFQGKEVFTRTFNTLDVLLSEVGFTQKTKIGSEMIRRVFNQEAPVHDFDTQMRLLADMDERLKKRIYGQDQAIDEAYEFILSSCGDVTRQKPVVLGFFGPSGVGKTALGEEISLVMNGNPATVINMSEYSNEFKSSQLTGSSKGYVNSDENGLLAQIIEKNPRAVIILDEFEKAHPNVRQLFLGLFDKGVIHDNKVGDLDFSKTTLILTSNAGIVSTASMGFGAQKPRFVADMNVIKRSFPPELLGRMDAKILFQPLDEGSLSQILDKFMREFEPRFTQLGVCVRLSEKARVDFINQGMDPQTGARPLRHLLMQRVKAPVEIGVFKQRIPKGSHVVIQSGEEKGSFVIQKASCVLGVKKKCHTKTD